MQWDLLEVGLSFLCALYGQKPGTPMEEWKRRGISCSQRRRPIFRRIAPTCFFMCTIYCLDVNPGTNAAISTRSRSTWMMRTKRTASRRSMELWMPTVLLIESECINQRLPRLYNRNSISFMNSFKSKSIMHCMFIIVMARHLTLTSDHINNATNEFLRSDLYEKMVLRMNLALLLKKL